MVVNELRGPLPCPLCVFASRKQWRFVSKEGQAASCRSSPQKSGTAAVLLNQARQAAPILSSYAVLLLDRPQQAYQRAMVSLGQKYPHLLSSLGMERVLPATR